MKEQTAITIELPAKTTAFSFYAEPDRFAGAIINATANTGASSGDVLVKGEAGASFFGFYSTAPSTHYLSSVTVAAADHFAIGELRISSDAPQPKWLSVAMGDSYSSGEGAGSYSSSTNNDQNQCHRSSKAYGALLGSRVSDYKPQKFVACSGAVTADLFNKNHQWDQKKPEPAQLSALATPIPTVSEARRITLTIGGNDVGFARTIEKCLIGPQVGGHFECSKNKEVREFVTSRVATLGGAATKKSAEGTRIYTYSEIFKNIALRAPSATIYIAGYPEFFGDKKSYFKKGKYEEVKRGKKKVKKGSGWACKVGGLGHWVDYSDAQWMNSQARSLNGTIKQAVKLAAKGGLKVKYVAPRFDGHGLCDKYSKKATWINGVKASAVVESFHPTAVGQSKGYYEAFKAAK